MIKYQRISGVSISEGAELPSITSTPEGRAMGAVPGWQAMIDPAYSNPLELSALNRATGDQCPVTVISSMTIGQMSGNPSFDLRSSDDSKRAFINPNGVNLDPNRWTVFSVVNYGAKPPEAVSGGQWIIRAANTDVPPDSLYLSVAVPNGTGNAFYVQEGSTGSPERIVGNLSPSLLERNTPTLLMATFSVERGLTIYDNGKQIARNESDTRPLTYALEGSELRFFQEGYSEYGMSGVINQDLSAPENTGHRRAIEKFLMTKYDIPEGPQ